jgi:hypothetical protein
LNYEWFEFLFGTVILLKLQEKVLALFGTENKDIGFPWDKYIFVEKKKQMGYRKNLLGILAEGHQWSSNIWKIGKKRKLLVIEKEAF